MFPVRRELRATREMAWEELASLLPRGDERFLCNILIRRAGEVGFDWLPRGEPARAGDELLLYAIEKANLAALAALNSAFDAADASHRGAAWPDERALIERHVPERGARILEVCCGAGRVTTHLPRGGNRVVGLDVNPRCLRAARALDGERVDYLCGDATHLPFADGSFDFTCVLENSLGVLFESAPLALAELIRATRARGRVLIGLREQAGWPDRFHLYATADGLVNVAQTFDAESSAALLADLPATARARIAAQERLPGAPRPWGGATFYLLLTLA